MPDIPTTDNEWKEKLSEEAYHALREKGTEAPFTGEYVHTKEDGLYRCAGCGAVLFDSHAKFDSGTGWPSFDSAIPGAIERVTDTSAGMIRTEIRCATCHGHLGHVFDDGPTSTGERYCLNSVCLKLDSRPSTLDTTSSNG